MSQLSCPACHVSINPRGALALAYCPRCLTRRKTAVPLVTRESGGPWAGSGGMREPRPSGPG
jgi:hypothetical protein